MKWAVLCWLIAINIIAFFLMWLDKERALRKNAWRISEKTLFLPPLLGGSVGAIIGMWVFRHKTRRWYFVWGLPGILIVQIVLAVLAWLAIH